MVVAVFGVVLLVAALGAVALVVRLRPPTDPPLAMAFGFLLVLAGGFLVVGTRGPGYVVGLVLLAAGVVVGALALRGARDRTRQSTTVD